MFQEVQDICFQKPKFSFKTNEQNKKPQTQKGSKIKRKLPQTMLYSFNLGIVITTGGWM